MFAASSVLTLAVWQCGAPAAAPQPGASVAEEGRTAAVSKGRKAAFALECLGSTPRRSSAMQDARLACIQWSLNIVTPGHSAHPPAGQNGTLQNSESLAVSRFNRLRRQAALNEKPRGAHWQGAQLEDRTDPSAREHGTARKRHWGIGLLCAHGQPSIGHCRAPAAQVQRARAAAVAIYEMSAGASSSSSHVMIVRPLASLGSTPVILSAIPAGSSSSASPSTCRGMPMRAR